MTGQDGVGTKYEPVCPECGAGGSKQRLNNNRFIDGDWSCKNCGHDYDIPQEKEP